MTVTITDIFAFTDKLITIKGTIIVIEGSIISPKISLGQHVIMSLDELPSLSGGHFERYYSEEKSRLEIGFWYV